MRFNIWSNVRCSLTTSTVPSCGGMENGPYTLPPLYFEINMKIKKPYYHSFCLALNHIPPSSISLFVSLFLPYSQCRSGEHREGHRRHPLLTFLPLQQPALSFVRTGRRAERWGRRAEADRKPVSIRPLHPDSAHLAHYWHIMLVHLTLNNHRERLTFVGGLRRCE